MRARDLPSIPNVLRYLADLSESAGGRPNLQAVEQRGHIVAIGWRHPGMSLVVPGNEPLRRLGVLDRLHSEERLLRLGWLWVAGSASIGGERIRVLAPLLTAPIELTDTAGTLARRISPVTVHNRDDLSLNPWLIPDRVTREKLEESVPDLMRSLEWKDMTRGLLLRYQSLWSWMRQAYDAAALGRPELTELQDDPWEHRDGPKLKLIPGSAIYLSRNIDAPSVAGDLRTWAGLNPSETALGYLYGDAGEPAPAEMPEIQSAYPLNSDQVNALRSARESPVTVVSGPPGTGKSHAAAALAIDEVAQGASVLVATQSEHAADVITELLGRYPGPQYVRFGSQAQRREVADALSSGLANPQADGELRRLHERHEVARQRLGDARRRILAELERESAFSQGLSDRAVLGHLVVDAPAVLDSALNWRRVQRLAGNLEKVRGPFRSWRRWRSATKLRDLLQAEPSVGLASLIDAVRLGEAERAVRRGMAGGGVALRPLWHELEAATAEWREENGHLVESIRRGAENRRRVTSRAVGALATALRSGRSVRRRLLRELPADEFLDVLPLWVGTLNEIDDSLPLQPGMFDVLIVDEATQTDQMRAASAVARAKRLVVFGDAKQLRHVSFVADEAIRSSAVTHKVSGPIANVLDVRRNSLFDAAASAAPITQLTEHFRSVPHIIGFSDRRFYGGNLRLMTQHPSSESRDAIRVIRTDGQRESSGVNGEEVEAAVQLVRGLIDKGNTSIGIVTPFRAQADRLEAAVLDELTSEEVLKTGLRIGTVHAFQGNERDTVAISTVVGPANIKSNLRFIEDPNLFNVMVTRARDQVIVITSVGRDQLPAGLFHDYLKHADEPPIPGSKTAPARGWVAELAHQIEAHGIRVVSNYPVAGFEIDLAVGEGASAIGVECTVHSDGAAAHVARHEALRRAGWTLVDMFQSRWLVNTEAAVEELVRLVLERSGP